MSATHTTPAPAAYDPRAVSDKPRLRWIGGGGLAAAILAAVAIAAWPASETDKARADGQSYGQAVAGLHSADTPAEVDAALGDVHSAAVDARDHAGDAVADQVAAQEDALERAVDGFVGANTTDGLEADLYQAELDTAVDDLDRQADDFRTQGPEVQQAFWDGYQDGLAGD